MKRKNTIFSKLYVVLCLAFFYLPILVTMIFSFNSSKSLTRFTGFSLRWYGELINNMEISKAVYVSVTVAILATVISTVLGTITAIGLSKSRKVLKEMVLTINNFPILNPEIVTAIGLDAAVFFAGNDERLSDHAAGTYRILYALCDHQRISEGTKPGSEPCQCSHGSWRNAISGTYQGYCAYDQRRDFCGSAPGIYYVL